MVIVIFNRKFSENYINKVKRNRTLKIMRWSNTVGSNQNYYKAHRASLDLFTPDLI